MQGNLFSVKQSMVESESFIANICIFVRFNHIFQFRIIISKRMEFANTVIATVLVP